MKKFYCKSFIFEDPKKALKNIVDELKKSKDLIEQLEPDKPAKEAPTSTNRPPNISSVKRNDQYRTDSKREKDIFKATRKNFGC